MGASFITLEKIMNVAQKYDIINKKRGNIL